MIESNDIIYAQLLKILRTESKKIQFEVALDLNLHDQRVLSDYESAKKHFSDEFIKKICGVFKISFEEFHKRAKKIGLDKTITSRLANEKKDRSGEMNNDNEIKLLFYRKENIELKLEKIKLELLLCKAQFKLEALPVNPNTKSIYVVI